MNKTIGIRLTIGFILTSLILVSLSAYAIVASRQSLKEAIGRSSIFMAEEMLKGIDRAIYLKIELLQTHSKHGLLQHTVLASNKTFEGSGDIRKLIDERDREWVTAPMDHITPFMLAIIGNALSDSMREEFIDFFEKKYGYSAIRELFVTNRYGANVAQTGKTSDYRQDDEEWWQRARDKGFYVGFVEFDESAAAHVLPLAVRVDDGAGNFIGVIRAELDAKTLIREAELSMGKFETSEIWLISGRERLLYATQAFRFLEDVKNRPFYQNIHTEKGYFIARMGGREKMFSYAHSKGYKDFHGLNWVLMVAHDIEEILRPSAVLKKRIITVSIGLIMLGLLIALILSRSITIPIRKLMEGTRRFGHGDPEYRVDIRTKDEIGQLAAAFNDMAEKRLKAEEEIKRYAARLEKVNKDLEAFTYSVSHDLRAPLRAIDSFAKILIEDHADRLDQEGRRVLDVIINNTQKMGRLIDDLLAFSRLDRKEIKTARFSMNNLTHEVMDQFRSIIKDRNVQLTVGSLPDACADRAMIREVMTNLLSNAIKFTRDRDPAIIDIGGKAEGDENVYSIRDNGVGFNMNYTDKLFKVFQRLHSPRQFEGTGVGLVLIARIVQKHGGRVWAEGEVDKGAAFYFSLSRKEKKDE